MGEHTTKLPRTLSASARCVHYTPILVSSLVCSSERAREVCAVAFETLDCSPVIVDGESTGVHASASLADDVSLESWDPNRYD